MRISCEHAEADSATSFQLRKVKAKTLFPNVEKRYRGIGGDGAGRFVKCQLVIPLM